MLFEICWFGCLLVVFFKHKTAYEMRSSDWSSDVCSSDLSYWRRTQEWRGRGQHERYGKKAHRQDEGDGERQQDRIGGGERRRRQTRESARHFGLLVIRRIVIAGLTGDIQHGRLQTLARPELDQ